jgi:radical SAM protein with 4Fe4S-binding SPASM domain
VTTLVPDISVAILRERLGSRAAHERVPLSADIEIIATCNFACKHCYIAPCAERDDVMPLERANELFDMLQRAGTLTILLTGGEIFTHKQFKEIYLSAKRHGFFINLNTNGYMIGPRWADFLAEMPPSALSISIYGMSNERYEAVTGIPNAFTRIVRSLDLLQERGIRYELKCPAMTLTVDELPAMQAFAKARGVTFRYDPIMTPDDHRSLRPVEFQLSAEEIVRLDEQFDPGGTESLAFAQSRPPTGTNVYLCGAGKTSMHVNVHGGVSTCLSSRQIVGNLFEQGFEAVWGALGGKVAKRFPDGHPCATCQFRGMCAGCPATVERMTGLPEGYVQQYCKITHLRAHRIGLHATGIPRTMVEGIPRGVTVPGAAAARALPVLN